METTHEVLSLFRPAGIPYALLILVLTFVGARLVHRFVDRLGQLQPLAGDTQGRMVTNLGLHGDDMGHMMLLCRDNC